MSLVSKVPFQLTGRYAERNKWENLNGPGDSRVTGLQIIKDEGLVGAWDDKVALVTGVSSVWVQKPSAHWRLLERLSTLRLGT
jgi:hypothetical protein